MPAEDMGQWQRDGEALVRELKFDDFAQAMAYVNRVADLAEEVNHHPDILVHGWNHVRLTLTTHSAGALTDNDYEMARKIDQIQ
jgi:4a-hydroxytetrahydrobiopterin dehydratase